MARDRFPGDFESTLRASRADRPAGYEALWNWLASSVRTYLARQGAADAEDSTSEVFLRVFRDIAKFEGDELAFRSWVFTIAHHRLIDERRRTSRRPVVVELLPTDGASPSVPTAASAEAEAVAALGTTSSRALIEDLSPDQRDVLLLRFFGDMTIEQIAHLLGKSSAAVKALQRRGLAQLSGKMFEAPVPLSGDETVAPS